MATRLWVARHDAEMLRGIVPVELAPHLGEILTGDIENAGLLGVIGRQMVIGRKRLWVNGEGKQKQSHPFARIDNHPMYSNGVVLTPYSDIDVECHLGTRTISKRTALERVELFGSDQDDFAKRVFSTYFHPTGIKKRPGEMENHFVLYETEREREIESRQD